MAQKILEKGKIKTSGFVLPKVNLFGFLKIEALIIGAIFLIFLVCMFFKTHDVSLKVTGYSWERSVEVEKKITVRESGSFVPKEAYDITTYSDGFRHYRNGIITTGAREQKTSFQENGICANKSIRKMVCEIYMLPAEKNEYSYKIDKMVCDRIEITKGTNRVPYWPNVNIGYNEKEKSRLERYYVFFQDKKGDRYSKSFDKFDWNKIYPDWKCIGKINSFGILLKVI